MIFNSLRSLIFVLAIFAHIGDGHAQQERDMEHKYTKLLTAKRIKHHEAVTRIIELNDMSKQSEMVTILVKKIFEMLSNSLENLSRIKSEVKDIEMVKYNQEILNDISTVIENTAFVSDLGLHFPRAFHKIYDKKSGWKTILKSAFDLTVRSGLIDDETSRMVLLMEQEAGLAPKEENFVNPFESTQKKEIVNPIQMVVPAKKKEKKKRGPGLSGGRHNEF